MLLLQEINIFISTSNNSYDVFHHKIAATNGIIIFGANIFHTKLIRCDAKVCVDAHFFYLVLSLHLCSYSEQELVWQPVQGH